ncbi:hypothetical protein L1857_24615 [Amycolatopsis thermalba]|uniref:Uncharacterized protein n=1 Tax=Amycolatopsis thermalba TaxID=944492 RepID=A0ABY4P0I8_9PSEU|nr:MULTISPECIES: hypothetical protein [Amycolatopsis]UQS25763.1 hypothetical protein L1857_24615 [Amycolatopsis thermalba]
MRAVLIAGALAGMAVLAGCGPERAVPEENAAAITWSEHVCAAVRDGGAKLSQLPGVDASDAGKAREGLVTYLASLSQALTDLGHGITREGPPPVTDGQATVDRAMDTLNATKSSVDAARAALESAPITDQASFEQAVRGAGDAFAHLGTATEGPTKDLTNNPELAKAFEKAPTCQALDGA